MTNLEFVLARFDGCYQPCGHPWQYRARSYCKVCHAAAMRRRLSKRERLERVAAEMRRKYGRRNATETLA